MITYKGNGFEFEVPTESLCEIAIKHGHFKSKSEFKRVLDGGAIYFNGKKLGRDSMIWDEVNVTLGELSAKVKLPVIRMI